MNHTTNNHRGAGASARHAGCYRARFVARAAGAMAVTVAVGLGLAACGGGDEQLDPAAGGVAPTGTAAPQTPATGAPATGDPNGGGSGTGSDGSGSNGSGSSGTGDGDGQPTGPPPRIVGASVERYVTEEALGAEVFGHAYDDDSPDPQLRVDRLEVQWGDGTTTSARLEGHGAFRDYHEYHPSYEGKTVTVRIVAHGHGGQTTFEEDTVKLSR